jgi:hypothetical protein
LFNNGNWLNTQNGVFGYEAMIRGNTMPELSDILMMRQDGETYAVFCENLLSQVVGRNEWKTRGGSALISEIATVSDEAFAILLLENNYDVWTKEVLGPTTGSDTVVTSKYTLNGAGTKKNQGWTNEGLNRYNKLAALVSADRSRDSNKTWEKTIKKMKSDAEDEKKGNKGKRKSADEENGPVVCYYEGGPLMAV